VREVKVIIWPAASGGPRRLSLNLFYAKVSCGPALTASTIQSAKGGKMAQMVLAIRRAKVDAMNSDGGMN
jgi:hypothetical protein